jgi:aminoglycoside 6'-N-acetyltransferase I
MRPFQESDLDACVDLYIATFAQPPWSETWAPPLVHARLQQIVRTPGFWGAVILADDHVIGFALGIAEPWHEGDHFYLKEMCIATPQQRQGLGTQLLEYMTQELAAAGTKRLYLLTARGEMSEAFYAKAGFYTSPKMILMAKRL